MLNKLAPLAAVMLLACLPACEQREQTDAATLLVPAAAPSADPSVASSVTGALVKQKDDWVEVRPEPNVSLKLRDGWSANRAVDGAGPIIFSGPNKARVVVWPVFVLKGAKTPAPAIVLVDFAKKEGAALRWNAPAPFGKNAVRMFGEGGNTVAQATFVYSDTSAGRAGYWYLTSASRADYAGLQPVFAGLMEGVRIYGGGTPPTKPPAAAQTYVPWQEPNEGAYVTQVPKGWKILGGIVRPDPLRLLDPIAMTSPDGEVYAFSGDGNLELYKTPTQMELQLGMTEGSRNGAAVLMRYRTAVELLPQYLQQRFGAQCRSLQIANVHDLKDMARAANADLAAMTAPGNFQQVDFALADFGCANGAVGMVQMGTYISGIASQYGSEGFGMWQISNVAGFIAPQRRADEAGQAVIKMLTSRKIDQRWAQGNQQMVAQINAISQKSASEMSAQITSRYSASSNASAASGNSSAKNDLGRQWQNSILDQTDVVDTATGETYKVESGASYYWINQQGTAIAGTNSPSQPTVDYRAMTQLP